MPQCITPEGLVAKHVLGMTEHPRNAVVRNEALRYAVPEVRVPKYLGYVYEKRLVGGSSWILMERAPGINPDQLPRTAPLRGVALDMELSRIANLTNRRTVGIHAARDLTFENVTVDKDGALWIFDQ